MLRGVKTKDDFKDLLKDAGLLEKTYGKVGQVSLFSHSGVGDGPVFHDTSGRAAQFTKSESAIKLNWSGSAEAKFYDVTLRKISVRILPMHRVFLPTAMTGTLIFRQIPGNVKAQMLLALSI